MLFVQQSGDDSCTCKLASLVTHMHTDPQGKVFMHVSVRECKRERLCNLSFVISVNSKFKMVTISLQKSEIVLSVNH